MIITAKLKEGVSKARVNRVTMVVNLILTKAVKEWQCLEMKPHIRKFKEPKIRIRWITQEEARRLIMHLPDHLAVMVQFTLPTGLWETNVVGLQWNQIDMQRRAAWIHPDQAKSAKAIGISLNDAAISILKFQIGKHLTHVFTYQNNPVSNARTWAWRKALKRAGIDNFRWHYLRHTWASWHVQNGAPLYRL